MPRISVRRFEANDVEPAAALLAARHKRDRIAMPVLSSGFEREDVLVTLIAPLARSPRVEGVVAMLDGRMAGFLFGEKMLFGPADFPSTIIPPHSISIPNHGHAAEPGEQLFPLYRAMYSELAAGWVRDGFFEQQTHIFAGDPELQEAWVALGFGRTMTAVIRSTEPLAVEGSSAVHVNRASTEDLDVVVALSDSLFKFHSRSPIFWPFLPDPQAAARDTRKRLLEDPNNAYFVAYQDGRPIAMQTYNVPGFSPAIAPRYHNVYLWEGIVEQDARTGGIGTRLLAEGLNWAREQGHEWCTLHFASGNPSGGPFWLSHGFVPIEYTMSRHIDERIAWANGW